MIPGDSRRTSMRVMRTAEATVTMLLDKSLNEKVNMNRTHIDLKILSVVIPQANQNTVTCHQRRNQQNWFDSCELFFFFEPYVYYKSLSSSINSPIPHHTHNISTHISPSIVLLVDILSKTTRVRFCHFITK